jgi:tetratricopeptide (TPR) repeat protein
MVQRNPFAWVLAVALLSAPLAAQFDEAAFHGDMSSVETLIDKGAFRNAYERVQEILVEHEGQDYVLADLARVNEVIERSFFNLTHGTPSPEDLIAGELLSYDKRSGKIKVRYRKDPDAEPTVTVSGENKEFIEQLLQLLGMGGVGAGDFTYYNGIPVHPLHFSGQYTVEIKGSLPEEGQSGLSFFFGSPRFMVGIQDDIAYQVDFGVAQSKRGSYGGDWADGKITRIQGKRRETLDSNDQTPLKYGKKYSIKVQVSSRKITATCNGKTFLSAKKPDDVYGQFGFRNCPNVSEMLITGTANTAWLEGLQDRRTQEAWREFREAYDPKQHVPSWLKDHVEKSEVAVWASMYEDSPGDPSAWGQLEELQKLEKRGKFAETLEILEGIVAEGAEEGARRHFLSLAHANLGDMDASLENNEYVCEGFPEFLPAHIIHAQLLQGLDRGKEARADLVELIDAQPDEPRLHVELARQFIAEGKLGSAHTVIDAAVEDGIPTTELHGIRATLNRAERGPEWTKPHEFKSRNYLVVSDLSAKVASEAGQTLEQSLAMYTAIFGKAVGGSKDPDRYRVYLFSGEAGFHAYTRDLFGSAQRNTLGLYSGALKQLLIWNLPEKEMMMRTIRHEGLHQFLDRMLDVTPIWFNEGLAEYFETAELVRGRWQPGAPVKSHVAQLLSRKTKWAPLGELVRMKPAKFMSDPGLHYAESWALIHTLLEGDRKTKAIFQDYLDALAEGLDQDAAADRAFEGVDFRELRAKVKDHLEGL